MKKAILILILFQSFALLQAQTIDWDSVRADYIKKYQPQQMPAWLFPIIFEEGTGQRDTIYLGYDADAKANVGEIKFGELLIPVDTTKFNVSLCLDFSFDSIYQVLVSPLINNQQCGDGVFEFHFLNGLLPLTIYWDRNTFYDTALPYPDKSPAPRAEGLWTFDYPTTTYWDPSQPPGFCPFDSPIIMTDTMRQPGSACWHTDSIYFFNINGTPNSTPSLMSILIRAWTGQVVGINKIDEPQQILIYPNPVNDILNVEIDHSISVDQILFMNNYGQIIKELHQDHLRNIVLEDIPPGFYFIIIKSLSSNSIHKFIKI